MSTAPSDTTAPELASRAIDASPVHYGWVVLVAGTLGMAMTIPGQTVGVSVFLDPIIADLGLSRSAASTAYTVATLAGSFGLPFFGRFVDRRGPRMAVVFIAAAFALACVVMGLAQGLVTLLLGFTLIRGLGQGALGLVSLHAINIWFVRRRGMAVGLAGLGFAAATATVPLAIEASIGGVGWRWTYVLAGAVVAAVMLPAGGGLFRHRPERYGLAPDGNRPPPPRRNQGPEVHYELASARRTVTFWLYVAGGFLTAALGTGLVFHHFSIMATGGLDRGEAASMFVAYGFVLASASLLTGYLVDRVPPRFLLSASLFLMAGAMVAAPRIGTAAAVVGYGMALGAMQGMSQAIQSTVYAHYFGRIHLGSIKGLATTVTIAGTAAGPLLLALGYDASGSYAPVLTLSAALPALLATVSPFLPLTRGGRVL